MLRAEGLQLVGVPYWVGFHIFKSVFPIGLEYDRNEAVPY